MAFQVLPGRVAVEVADASPERIAVPEWVRAKAERLYGRAEACRWGTVVASGRRDLQKGDRVVVRESGAALRLTARDYSFVPDGTEIRIYGVHEPIESVVVGVEVADATTTA